VAAYTIHENGVAGLHREYEPFKLLIVNLESAEAPKTGLDGPECLSDHRCDVT
jgi:hypothetical protein